MRRSSRLAFAALLSLALALGWPAAPATARFASSGLPDHLTDQEFWQVSSDLSEPNGQFQSDNLLSNEMAFATMVPDLIAHTKPGGVYLGVGPEQNFTYIAAMKPRWVFITDIRRGNLELQLMYKALFEMSADRAEFVSRLYTKPRPAGLSKTSTVREIMNAFWDVPSADEAQYAQNLKAIDDWLTRKHGLPLSSDDLDGIAGVYRAFYWYGPAMTYSANVALNGAAGRGVTYADLMLQSDSDGNGLSYLGSDEKFSVLKDLERKNLIVPVVGNFSGPKALRAEGAYLRSHDATVSAFYLSNVEMYLHRAGTWGDFCANVASMPLDDNSVFIRPRGGGVVLNTYGARSGNGTITTYSTTRGGGPQGLSGLVPMKAETANCSAGLAPR
jgi:hypothetical protein